MIDSRRLILVLAIYAAATVTLSVLLAALVAGIIAS